MYAAIALEDGTIFRGKSFGTPGEKCGEVVFNTSMSGYQEVLTDPSYKGQIVTMTYPLIGNYGTNSKDFESKTPHVEGFIVREYSKLFSNWRSETSLEEFLRRYGIIGIEEVDTRALTRHIREAGAMKAAVATGDFREKDLIEKAKKSPGLIGRDLVKEVTSQKLYRWNGSGETETFHVVVMDFGTKYNILRSLAKAGCRVTVVPAFYKAQDILALKPDGLVLSNGPGDPEGVPYAIETVREIISSRTMPIMGICLGHQILGLVFGGKTYKLKFGHHGGNHPVMETKTGKTAITVQNHGFCVDMSSLENEPIEFTHMNLNDHTLEGMRHKELPIFSVQFHPEASPGPHDASGLFKDFVDLMAYAKT